MAAERTNRRTIIAAAGLLGASAGIVLGLIEAGCLRLTHFPLPLMKPLVPFSFWFFAPLLISLIFGALGLLAGTLAALAKSRFLGMMIIAGFFCFPGAYLALVLQNSQSSSWWYFALQLFVSPAILLSGIFAWTLAVLWATRKPDSPLGLLAGVPQRLWASVVLGLMAALAVAMGVCSLPDRFSVSAARAMGKTQLPNIVLIVWDTTRADHLSSYGYFRNTTPNLDRFAQAGVLFENAISDSSWTLPATAGVFTGLLPHQHGAGKMGALGNGPRTLAEILRSGGYQTAGFNANPYYGPIPWGLSRGFETYIDSTSSLGYGLDATRMGSEFVEPYAEKWFARGRMNQFNAHQLNQYVYRWFDNRSGQPFFLFLNYNDAHEPYEVPSPYDRLYGQMSVSAERLLHSLHPARYYLPPFERQGTIAAYDQCLNYIDSQAAELLRFLEHSPEWPNTYVIITSDHGEGFGEHDTYSHGWNLYREVLRVPLIIAGPGIPAGVRVTGMAKTRHIFETSLEFAGLKKAVVERTSLARMWGAGYVPDAADESVVSELLDNTPPPAPQGLISITTREWQLICRPGVRRNRLYHWASDPLEQQNVADLPENQALVQQLQASLIAIIKRSYRPWRDPGYLQALSGAGFSPVREAARLIPLPSGGSLLPPGAGAAQALFPSNPETTQLNSKNPDEELLRSLPYNAR